MRLALGTCLGFLAAAVTAPETTLVDYLGGSGTDDCDGITLDRASDIYLACHSDSPNFPHVPGQAQPRAYGAMDAIVVKIEAAAGFEASVKQRQNRKKIAARES